MKLSRTVIPMIPHNRGDKVFDIIVYGRTRKDLCTVPNEVISELARKYPDYSSSMFLMYDFPNGY